MEYLGFATQFFTLWEVSRESVTYYGRPATRVVCTFIKNVSKDEQVARAKYPDAPFDATLRGCRSFSRVEVEKYADDVFAFGKYAGTPVADCDDLGYLFWVLPQLDDARRVIAENVLVNSGKYGRYGDDIVAAEELAAIEAEDEYIEGLVAGIIESGRATVEATSNIHFEDEYTSAATHGIMLTWNAADLAEYYYSGCTYYLPKQGDKAKRIKGKTLEVSVADYNVEQFPFGKRLSIRVAGFQLKK